jgi:nucleotide-binding universal stress UspA family protein
MAAQGPILIGFDGTDASEHAVREAGALLRGRPALVVVVWKESVAFELLELPTATIGLPPTALDIHAALETDRALYEHAQRLSQKGAALAREAGLEAEGLVVADDLDTPIPETLVRVADERDAQAIVVGAHGHGAIGELLLGSVTRGVIRRATRPVVVVRRAEDRDER